MTVEGVTAVTPTGETLRVREVWEDNLEHEMKIIRDCIEKYPFVAMDTEFPGVVARPVGNFKNSSEYHYQTLRVNVDMLKLIQLGLTLSDKDGNLPRHNDEICVWQFNFREFDVANDIHSGEPPRVRRGGASSSRLPSAGPDPPDTPFGTMGTPNSSLWTATAGSGFGAASTTGSPVGAVVESTGGHFQEVSPVCLLW